MISASQFQCETEEQWCALACAVGRTASHQGRSDDDDAELRRVPAIRRQLDKLDGELLRDELREYGA